MEDNKDNNKEAESIKQTLSSIIGYEEDEKENYIIETELDFSTFVNKLYGTIEHVARTAVDDQGVHIEDKIILKAIMHHPELLKFKPMVWFTSNL
jgi:hypothetical protein